MVTFSVENFDFIDFNYFFGEFPAVWLDPCYYHDVRARNRVWILICSFSAAVGAGGRFSGWSVCVGGVAVLLRRDFCNVSASTSPSRGDHG